MKTTEQKLAQAYLLGSYLGDGHCHWNTDDSRHSVYQFVMPSIDDDLLDKVKRSIIICFPFLEDRVRIVEDDKGKYKRLRCSSKDLCQFLRSRCDIKQRLPKFSDPTLFKEFVSGLMDTDGWITEYHVKNSDYPGFRYQMGFATTSPWYRSLRKQLRQSGVKVGSTQKIWKPKDKQVQWADCRRMYINITSFVTAGFYFSIMRKQSRLQNWQCTIRNELPTTTRLAPPCAATRG